MGGMVGVMVRGMVGGMVGETGSTGKTQGGKYSRISERGMVGVRVAVMVKQWAGGIM